MDVIKWIYTKKNKKRIFFKMDFEIIYERNV